MTAVREPKPVTWQEVAAEQDGVLARWQALRAGLSPDAWDWRLRRGSWQSPVPGIAVLHNGALQARELRWVAVLHAGAGVALSGDAALAEWGVTRLEVSRLDVAVPRARHVTDATTSSGLVVVHHRLVLGKGWRVEHHGMPVLSAHVAVLHAAAWATTDRAAELRLAIAVQQRVSAVPLLRHALASVKKLPRRQLVLAVLDDLELGATALSELDFLRFCRAHGLPEPDEMQVLVRAGGKRYLDARYRKQKVSVEVDGAHHQWVEQWDADALRSLQLAVARQGSGEQLIRVTRSNLRHDAVEVAGLLRQLLL